MTIDDLKRLDKRLRQIQDPFGTGFQIQLKVWDDFSRKYGTTICEIKRQYRAWKMRK